MSLKLYQKIKARYSIPQESKLAVSMKNLLVFRILLCVLIAAVPFMFMITYVAGNMSLGSNLYYAGMLFGSGIALMVILYVSKKPNYYLQQTLLILFISFLFILLIMNFLLSPNYGSGLVTIYIGCLIFVIGFEVNPLFHAVLMMLIAGVFQIYYLNHDIYFPVLFNNYLMTFSIVLLAFNKRSSLVKREEQRLEIEEQNRKLEDNNTELERQKDTLIIDKQALEAFAYSQKDEIRLQNERLIRVQNNTIVSLANLVENRDEDTGGHVLRTRDYVGLIAMKAYLMNLYPELDEKMIRLFVKAAPMHDIGKIAVPDAVLKKPGRLTPEEFEQIKLHTVKGGEIVESVLGAAEDEEYVRVTKEIATSHHEKYDGTGYPYGLAGEDIPLGARMMAVADVFDALVSPRCYKAPMTEEEAFSIIMESAGTHFDPQLARLFIDARDEVLEIHEKYE